jgi:predicted ArsR family transcriptional regulator
MCETKDVVPEDEARKAVRDMARRVGLLHIAFARTLVDEFGDERGEELIRKAITTYGTWIGERTHHSVEEMGLEPTLENFILGSDLSPIGFESTEVVVNGEKRSRSSTCALAEVWQEYGENELGGLYCGVDQAKMQAYNPHWTYVHTSKISDGDEFCEFAIRPAKDEA